MIDLLVALSIALQQSPQRSPMDDDFIRAATIRPVDYVMFHQEIDDENVDRVSRLIKPGTILDLQSPGGDFRASLRFAQIVRDRAVRVRVSGECSSGCAIVWTTARDRLADGFSAVTFHGNPISSWDWISARREHFSEAELRWAEGEQRAFREFLAASGIEPWLFQCANRLQNQRHAFVEPSPSGDRIATVEDYEAVWFPRAILEAAGVHGLDRYDRPNERQMRAIETQFGTLRVARKIYWAEDGDCNQDRIGADG